MSKSNQQRVPQSVSASLKPVKGEGVPYKGVFESLSKVIPFELGVVISAMPRGELQVCQPQQIPEVFVKSYAREFHTEDRATWQSIIKDQPLTGPGAWGFHFENSRFRKEFMRQCGLGHIVSVPLVAPFLPGFPGALHLYRAHERGDFTSAEVQQLGAVGNELNESIAKAREQRNIEEEVYVGLKKPAERVFIFDKDLKQRLPESNLNVLDERLQQQMLQHARHEMSNIGDAMKTDRVALPDSRGDLWIFQVTVHKHYSAIVDGPAVVFCIVPPWREWLSLRAGDFIADAELSRMIPSLKFMKEEYRRGPNLTEISRTAGLSPFHFHRRFTELMGLTPKHFMLEVQLDDCKRFLIQNEKELADIASICGFAHQSHFTSRFKQAAGLTPTKWRRLALERETAARFEHEFAKQQL